MVIGNTSVNDGVVRFALLRFRRGQIPDSLDRSGRDKRYLNQPRVGVPLSAECAKRSKSCVALSGSSHYARDLRRQLLQRVDY